MKKEKNISTIILLVEYILCGLVCIYKEESIYLALFGLVFFAAGLSVAFAEQKFGLIFLVSHGLTGLGIMIGALFIEGANDVVLADLGTNAYTWLIGALVLGIFALVSTIRYNLSNGLKNNIYGKNIIVLMFLIFLVYVRVALTVLNII